VSQALGAPRGHPGLAQVLSLTHSMRA
jgi:hypothetical protein